MARYLVAVVAAITLSYPPTAAGQGVFECTIVERPELLDNGHVKAGQPLTGIFASNRRIMIDKRTGAVLSALFMGWTWERTQEASKAFSLITVGSAWGKPGKLAVVYTHRDGPVRPFAIYDTRGVFEVLTGTCR